MALGWPVSEKGPAPGRPICPVARCRWISAAPLSVPWMDWLRPWHQKDSAFFARPNQRAAVTMSSAFTPQALATAAGVVSRTLSRRASKPAVWSRMKSRSTRSSHSSTCSSAENSSSQAPSTKKPPGGSTMITQGWKPAPNSVMPNSVPAPRISRTTPSASRPMVKPTPMPAALIIAGSGGFFAACASARPRMMQFTTMSWMKAPSAS